MSDKESFNHILSNGNCEGCWLNVFSEIKNASSNLRSKIILATQIRDYCKGDYLIKKGDDIDGVYCIQSGTVRVSSTGNRKKEFTLWIASAGDIVGLNSFINDEPFSFSASAVDKVKACFIPIADLKILLDKEPDVFIKLMKKVCEKINFVEQRITSISKKSTKAQCAEILISVIKKNVLPNDNNIYISYSVNELASLIGTTKNYLYKILLEFSNKGILSIRNRKLIINNVNALSLIADGSER